MKEAGKKIGLNILTCVLVVVIVGALALVAIFGQVIINWFKAIGWTYILTIVLTTLVNAIIFGIVDAIGDKRTKAKESSREDSSAL